MSLYSSFAESMISPMDSSIAPLQRVITDHEDTQNSIQSVVNSLSGLNGSGPLSGLTGAAVAHANQQLTQMTNQQLDVLKQAIAAIKSCASSSSDAVSSIESGLPINRFVEQIFRYFDIVGVITGGRSIADAAIEAVKEAFIRELESGIGIIDIAAAVFEVFGPIEAEVPPYIMKLFTTAQEIMSTMRVLEQLTAMATSSPVKELFSNIPAFSSDVNRAGYAQRLQQGDGTNLRYGVVNANPTMLTTIEASLLQIISALLGRPITPQTTLSQVVGGTNATTNAAGRLGAGGTAGANTASAVNVAGIPITIPQNLGTTGIIVVATAGIFAIFATGTQRSAPVPQPDPGLQALAGGQPVTGTGALPTTGSAPLPVAHPIVGTPVHRPIPVPSYHSNALASYYSAPLPAATPAHASVPLPATAATPALPTDAQIAAKPAPPMNVSEAGFGSTAMGVSASAMIGMAIMQALGQQAQGGGNDNSPTANILS